MSTRETFFSYSKYRWLWLNLFFLFVALVFYMLIDPVGGRRGSTWYGYFLGIVSTSMIFYLMAYGIRKRAYHSSRTTLKGWLSAHVWMGLVLLILVPLHSGFQIGWNIHGLTYILMVIVIVSGIWGAIHYKTLAPQIETHRGRGSMKTLIEQFELDSQVISKVSDSKSDSFLRLRNFIEVSLPRSFWKILVAKIKKTPDEKKAAHFLSMIPELEKQDSLTLLQLCDKKRQLAIRIQKEIQMSAKLKLWLLAHLPLSMAMLMALGIHIFSVLYYR